MRFGLRRHGRGQARVAGEQDSRAGVGAEARERRRLRSLLFQQEAIQGGRRRVRAPAPPPPVDPATLDRALATVSSRAPRLAAALLPFQREGVEFVLRKGGRALIAHDMGLGKTLQALAVLAHYSHEWPALVVVPASMRWPWVDALELWLDGLLRPGDVCVVRDGGCTSVAHPESKVVVVSYPLLVNPSIRAQVEAAKFRVVVADESHYLGIPRRSARRRSRPSCDARFDASYSPGRRR